MRSKRLERFRLPIALTLTTTLKTEVAFSCETLNFYQSTDITPQKTMLFIVTNALKLRFKLI
jgi:hypothetical protein